MNSVFTQVFAGAVEESEYIRLMEEAGFEDVKIVDRMMYNSQTLGTLANDACGCGSSDASVDQATLDKYADRVASVKVSARRPG